MTDPALDLPAGVRLAGISRGDLWTRYLGLGGTGSVEEMVEHIDRAEDLDDYEHNLIAQALNEAFLDQGRDHPVGYRHLFHREP